MAFWQAQAITTHTIFVCRLHGNACVPSRVPCNMLHGPCSLCSPALAGVARPPQSPLPRTCGHTCAPPRPRYATWASAIHTNVSSGPPPSPPPHTSTMHMMRAAIAVPMHTLCGPCTEMQVVQYNGVASGVLHQGWASGFRQTTTRACHCHTPPSVLKTHPHTVPHEGVSLSRDGTFSVN
jgi:hypothetical protein